MSQARLKVMVTGAAGSGGSYLLEHLAAVEPQNSYIALVRNEHSLKNQNLISIREKIQIEYCELKNYDSTLNVITREQPDQIYHLASNANVQESFNCPPQILENNIMSAANILEACRVQAKRPRFLMCSTSEVYGQVNADEVPIKETNALRPASPYAVSKTAQDLLASVYFKAYDMPVITTRMFTYINPRRENLFATSFAMQVAKIEIGLQKELLHGNLQSIRTHLDIRDATAAYFEVMKNGMAGEIYNLGGTQAFSVGDFLEILRKKATCPISAKLDSKLLRPVDVTLQVPDVSKFQAVSNWRPRYSIDESVEFLLQECRKRVRQNQ